MRIGIIGPSEVRDEVKISRLAKIIAELEFEVVLVPDKGSSSEYFAKEYLFNNGKKLYSVIPLDDKEFGFDWLNQKIGETINCGTWRNQPEKLNEETDVLVCIGYSAGVLAEIAYTKWFKKKPVFFIKELISVGLPKEIKLDLRYVSIDDFEKELENVK